LSLFIVHEAYQLGAPSHLIARMLGNVALDGVFGAAPLVGTPSTFCGARTYAPCGCCASGWIAIRSGSETSEHAMRGINAIDRCDYAPGLELAGKTLSL
jgi:hypothetical protein